MQFIINSNPAQIFELTSKEAFTLLAEAYNQNPGITDAKEQDAASIKAFVRKIQNTKTALNFETKKISALPFPVKFTGELVQGATLADTKFNVTQVTLDANTDFAKACLAKLAPVSKVAAGSRALAGALVAAKSSGARALTGALVAAKSSGARALGSASSVFKKIVPHAVSAGAAFGLNVALRSSLNPVAVVLSALGLTGSADAVRSYLKRSNLEAYKAKDDVAVAALTDNQKQAFADGVEAQKGYLTYFKSFVAVKDYRHGNAFYAGMAAEQNKDADLIAKIKRPSIV